MIVLLDTNVLLSAALRDRLPERVVLYVATNDDCKWIVTPHILAEYIDVLRRPKFGFSPETLAHWSALIDMRTVNVPVPATSPQFSRDPKDAPFLAAALANRADFLITGDNDLLQSQGIVPTRILTAAEFARDFQIT
jgi:putative PIN family toxin of toxin-antitoxin system